MSDQITVRAQEPEDIQAVTELMNQPQAIWGTLQLPFVSVAARRKRFEAVSPNETRLLAEIGGKVVGSIGLHRLENRRAHVGSIGMAVHDAYAGRGIGTVLMQAVVTQADRWLNLKRLELTVYDDNRPAIALYERFGFEREGTHRAFAWRDGAYVDAVAMARLRF